MLAKECYNAFAVDMYGQGIRPENKDDAGKQAKIYKSDAALARRRIRAALDYVRSRSDADATRIAAIGYCFGGSMALELARSGAEISGIASFHGGLSSPDPVKEKGIVKAPLAIYHGNADPNVPKEEVDAFVDEMVKADAPFSITKYPGAVHAFTQKDAGDDPSTGAAYNKDADEQSWKSLLYFLKEIFSK
jgi:dienelactone hydrolase